MLRAMDIVGGRCTVYFWFYKFLNAQIDQNGDAVLGK